MTTDDTCPINLNAGATTFGNAPCGKPAAYTAWLTSCAGCNWTGSPECTGHPVCLEHGAQLRAGPMPDGADTTTLLRLHAITKIPA
jgi:hypothetical protein